MGLFSKKPPCPICGGKISWFLPSKIEGEYICDTCYGKIDMEDGQPDHLTMQGFREYLAFYDQNQLLKDRFVISEKIDFGLWDTKIIFDYQNRLFCMSKKPDKTVFEAGQLKSFTIMEDRSLLMEGSPQGLKHYISTVPERAMALAPQISQFNMNKQMARTLDRMDDGKQNNSVTTRYFDVPEPFQAFRMELRLDHPYWKVIKFDMNGPQFDSNSPDINHYIRSYRSSIKEIEKLAAAFKQLAFPQAAEQSINIGASQAAYTTAAPPVDAIEEIKKYKALMEEGVISLQEFEAKKKQLLGI